MIDYNPKSNMDLVFRRRGSVFPKALLCAVPNAVLAAVLSYLYYDVWGLEPMDFSGFSAVWSSFTFVLGFLIVFRTQQAYSRYWEGATLLRQCRGEWFNATSSVIAFCTTNKEKIGEVERFQHLLIRLMSMLHCVGLQTIADMEDDHFEFIDTNGIDLDSLRYLASFTDKNQRCEIIIQWVQQLVVRNIETGVLQIAPPILSRFFQELSRGAVNVTQARNMTDIPFPFPYAQMLTVLLIIHWFLTPVVNCMILRLWWWSSLFTFVSVLAFWGTTLIAAELESPFGDDANDLPLAQMQADMNSSLWILLDQQTQRPPQFNFQAQSRRWLTKSVTMSMVGGVDVEKRDCSGKHPGRLTLRALMGKEPSGPSEPSKSESLSEGISGSASVASVASSLVGGALGPSERSLGSSQSSSVTRKASRSRKGGRYGRPLPAHRLQRDGIGGMSAVLEIGRVSTPEGSEEYASSLSADPELGVPRLGGSAGGHLPPEPTSAPNMQPDTEAYVHRVFSEALHEQVVRAELPAGIGQVSADVLPEQLARSEQPAAAARDRSLPALSIDPGKVKTPDVSPRDGTGTSSSKRAHRAHHSPRDMFKAEKFPPPAGPTLHSPPQSPRL